MLNKVLVVDDSPLIHQVFRQVMSRYCCTIIEAMNGQEALDVLETQRDIDLILLDIKMPVMNGIQFLEAASQLGIVSKIPTIVISSKGKEEDTIRGLKLGARGDLAKPFYPVALHEMIENLLKPEMRA